MGKALVQQLAKDWEEAYWNWVEIMPSSFRMKQIWIWLLMAAAFGAVGTAGQRCTTTRRLIIHEKIYNKFKEKLVNAYSQLKIGNPLNEKNHVGPLIDKDAVNMYLEAIEKCKAEGGKFHCGRRRIKRKRI